MSNPNYTAILMVLDESSSMSAFCGEDEDGHGQSRSEVMEAALHKMLEQQARKLAGYLTVDVGYFNDGPTQQGAIDGDPMMIDLNMRAGGGTDVYRGVYELASRFESRLDALPEDEKPGHVVVVVVTDGESEENFDFPQLAKKLVTRLINEKGWDFAFLGAYIGAMRGLRDLGIPKDCAVEENPTPEGIERMAERLGKFVSVARGGGEASFE